uniref:non-specific serine/threonine protein kinase n=1 Tax=Aegilops tauschii TaxID=37682 RepID=N1QWM1_AEGTA
MELSPWLILFGVLVQASVILADTNVQDTAGLTGIAASWDTKPSNWDGNDPCGDKWIGIICIQDRVTSIRLSSQSLSGTLSGDIQSLSELQYLDLSYNKDLGGSLPSSIGSLSNLQNLILVGCSFAGEIPKEIGQLSKLIFLSLNSNRFTGHIPPSLSGLSKLYWFDLAENKLTGGLPVFDGTNPGLDNLTNTKHFLVDNNNFSGSIPPTLGLLNVLEVLRFDNNKQLSGPVPTNINNLTKLAELLGLRLKHEQLCHRDMSNNTFNASDAPAWFTALPSLTSLKLRGNRFNGTLNIGSDFGSQLQTIDLQGNQIDQLTVGGTQYNKKLILLGNPICNQGNNEQYCKTATQSNPVAPPYSTSKNCSGLPATCLPSQLLSPSCTCAVPYKGTLFFRAPSFSDLSNESYYLLLEKDMKTKFLSYKALIDSIALHNPFFDANNNLEISLEVFPGGKVQFGEQDISDIGFILSNQTYKPPPVFGPYYFIAQSYRVATEVPASKKSKANKLPLIVGVAAGGAVVIAVLLLVIFFITRRKREPKKTEERSQSFASLDMKSTSTSVPQLRGARTFTFAELKKITNNFSEANDIGNGGFGKVRSDQIFRDSILQVYRGTLPTGQLVAVKRSQEGSLQGSLEFRTEIELLSRVHHKNVVSLMGFCLDQGEQMLVYEYIPNGTLKESLTGKSGVRLDWKRRLRVILGTAKGIAYLHELADPPIVHRDIKSSNVLLDERLNAKVSDFGLSKLLGEDGRGQGYLDPEYYMTQQLTEKSDVYSFGVLLLEMITAKKPLERGRYIVREVLAALDRSKDLYGLHDLLDPVLGASPTSLGGLEQYVDLALRCVEEAGADRPSMGEAVSEIERITRMAGGAPESASESMSYASRTPRHPYGGDSPSEYSGGGLPSSRVEPK